MLIGQEILVLGGGIAGLAAARALALRGARVRLAEQGNSAGSMGQGGGLQIAPNGVRVLDALGLGAEARALSLASRAVVLLDGFTGRQITRLDLAGHAAEGLDYLLFARGDLTALLADGAREAGVEVLTDTPGEVLEDTADGVRVRLAQDEAVVPLVLSADGFHSASRARLNPGGTLFFTGQVAWRAVVADQGDAPPETRAYLGPGCHLVTYPLTGGRRNIVAVEERSDWAEEGWHHPDDPANLRAAFGSFDHSVQALLDRVDEPRLWGLFRHPVAPRWHSDRLALLGDAAHPTLPFLAQGANMALEDAWVLAACLAAAPSAEALSRYQALRQPRVTRAIAAANANARNYHLRGLTRYGAHKVLRLGGRLAPGAALGRFDWLYRHDVTRES